MLDLFVVDHRVVAANRDLVDDAVCELSIEHDISIASAQFLVMRQLGYHCYCVELDGWFYASILPESFVALTDAIDTSDPVRACELQSLQLSTCTFASQCESEIVAAVCLHALDRSLRIALPEAVVAKVYPEMMKVCALDVWTWHLEIANAVYDSETPTTRLCWSNPIVMAA